MNHAHTRTAFFTTALIVLCLIWESIGAPLQTGGSWLALKGIFLLPFLPALWRGKRAYFIPLCLVLLPYALEGATRAYADLSMNSRYFAGGELLLSALAFFYACVFMKRTNTAVRAPRVRKAKSRLIFMLTALIIIQVWLYALRPLAGASNPTEATYLAVLHIGLALTTGILIFVYFMRLFQVSRHQSKPPTP